MSGGDQAREIAYLVIRAVMSKGAYANIALDNFLRRNQLDKKARALATELVYGTVRRRNTLDWVIQQVADRPLKKIEAHVLDALRLGVYQLFYMDRIPSSAAVNESVQLVKRYGSRSAAGFANAVLRNVIRQKQGLKFPSPDEDPVTGISLEFSHPEWMVKRWLARYGVKDTIKLCQANNRPPPVVLRTNRLKTTPGELMALLEQDGFEVQGGRYLAEALTVTRQPKPLREVEAYRRGWFQVQAESAMLVGYIVDPKPGERVLDACSAPGGKTTHLAELMGNRGCILAGDIHRHKLALVEESCRRLGISIVRTQPLDARELEKKYPGWADRVLVDAPCSGLGVLSRRPDSRWKKSLQQITELAGLALEILTSAAGCVKKGGVLVYCTCTLEPEENQQVVERFLENRDDFRLDPVTPYLPGALATREGAAKGFLQLLPHVDGLDGFFIARMVRNGEGEAGSEGKTSGPKGLSALT